MSAEVMHTQPVAFYPDRPGANLASQVEVFRAVPEITLTPEERAEILGVERILTKSQNLNVDLLPLTEGTVQGIESIYDKSINSTNFYLDYFLVNNPYRGELLADKVDKAKTSDEVMNVMLDGYLAEQQALSDAEALGISKDEILAASSVEDIRQLLLKRDYSAVKGAAIGAIEKRSAEFIMQNMVDAFAQTGFTSVDEIPSPTKLMVVRNPLLLAQKLEELRALKDYLKKYEATLIGKDNVTEGIKVMTEIHRRRVNELLTGLYPDATVFAHQAEATQTEEDLALAQRISKTVPPVSSFSGHDEQRMFSKIDKYRNGKGAMVNGEYTQISLEVAELADRVSQPGNAAAPTEYRYKGYEDVWKNAQVTAEEFRSWGEKFLRARGILSSQSHTDYDPDRQGRAEDGLWQAVIDSTTSLKINSQKGLMIFPPEPKRPEDRRKLAQISPAGAVPVINHEARHVEQHVEKEKLGLSITEKVGMDRSPLLAEGGGILPETQTQLEEFGQATQVNPQYVRAAQARLLGGGYAECVKAYFDSQLRRTPNANKVTTAKTAADRALRLFRSGGQTADKSPYFTHSGGGTFEYLEQELLAQVIRGTELEPLFCLTGVNIEMLAKLHKIGLFKISDINVPQDKASDILRSEIDAKILGEASL